jgi:hypothetical protein
MFPFHFIFFNVNFASFIVYSPLVQ